jgi:hypothetical protein
MSPARVVNVKFNPDASVRQSSVKGNSPGAPRSVG